MKMYLKKLITITSVLLCFELINSNPVLAENNTSGTVVKVRGRVIASIGGKKVEVKKGDKIPAKAFVQSQEKSFAIILFQDKTKLTLGPKSKIQVVNPSTDKDPGIINLLQGQIRNKITKPGKLNKYFVNSKAAAIGVRGTEFIAIYNPITNSLTSGGFSGTVAIGPSIEGELTVSNANNTIKDGGENMYFLKAKHFSSVQKTEEGLKISAPRKLSPLQYNQLKNNEEPDFSSSSAIVARRPEKKRTTSLPNVSEKVQNTSFSIPDINSTEAVVGENSRKQLPSGSFVDLNSGAIIPPPPGSEYDPNSGTYIIDSSFGSVSADGSYVPPEGMSINNEGKFVASSESTSDNAPTSSKQEKRINTLNKLVESARNSESIMLNPTSEAVVALNDSLAEGNESDSKDAKGNKAGKSSGVSNTSLDELVNFDSETPLPSVSMDTSCPGNICDRFDTAAPTSDEASQKTLVQFTIRVNKE
jgi:hypothetical protein